MREHIAREDAFALLKKYNKEPFYIQHGLTVEGVMKWFAKELGYGEDQEFWGVELDELIQKTILAMRSCEAEVADALAAN